MQAIILAGGKATRLQTVLKEIVPFNIFLY